MRHLKELGQNFLTAPAIAAEIAALGKLVPGDNVLEIGVGEGILTDAILTYGVELTAYELDQRLEASLSEKYQNQVRIIFQDALKADWMNDLFVESASIKLIANIPYQITSPLLARLENYAERFEIIVLMLQKEVAERLTARPGTKSYGALTLRMNLKFNVRMAFMVGKENFEPVPKVDSAVIVMSPRTFPMEIDDPARFYNLIIRAFAHRRKTLRNNLLPYYQSGLLDKAQAHSGINLSRRAETLNEKEFISLSNCLNRA